MIFLFDIDFLKKQFPNKPDDFIFQKAKYRKATNKYENDKSRCHIKSYELVLKLTSASSDIGIKGLFQSIGKKVLRLIMMNKSNK